MVSVSFVLVSHLCYLELLEYESLLEGEAKKIEQEVADYERLLEEESESNFNAITHTHLYIYDVRGHKVCVSVN